MRIWSLHPSLLDSKGLVALWRETLLAQKVLQGATKGYKNHAQLYRFKNLANPIQAISNYLWHVHEEALLRQYNFDASKIACAKTDCISIPVNQRQVAFEFSHLKNKLEKRDPEKLGVIKDIQDVPLHPLFSAIPGEIELWEKV